MASGDSSAPCYQRCGPDCESDYPCSCGECQSNCVCARGDSARCPDADSSGDRSATVDPMNPDLRLIVARALAAESGEPLGFWDEEDQLDWDRKAVAVLRELAEAVTSS